MAVRTDRNVLERVYPLDARTAPVAADVQTPVARVFHPELTEQLFEHCGPESGIWVWRVPRTSQSIHRPVSECSASKLALEVTGLPFTHNQHFVHFRRHQFVGEINRNKKITVVDMVIVDDGADLNVMWLVPLVVHHHDVTDVGIAHARTRAPNDRHAICQHLGNDLTRHGPYC